MKNLSLLLFISLFWVTALTAQRSLLQSGPMVGYAEMREVALWAQTNAAADVAFVYWDSAQPDQRFQTATARTAAETAYTAKLLAALLEPGHTYEYRLLINGQEVSLDYPTRFRTQPLWQWRTDPPGFTLAAGSCYYANDPPYDRPGRPYGTENGIFRAIHQKRPDVMLWLGDNVYLREPDWYSRSGIMYRYTHARSYADLQPLLASTHHYAVWDDHDYGPNDSNRSYPFKAFTREAFELFWANPVYGIPGVGGITSFFQYADVDFFLLDDRSFRTPNERDVAEKTILGREQLEWLIDALVTSKAPFKVVALGGQFLNTSEIFETYANLAPLERAYLLQRIEEEQIRNVIFLTGDRHHSVLSRYENGNGHLVYDLTVSPLSAGISKADRDTNQLMVPNTLVEQHNFALLTFRGPRLERELFIQLFDAEGKPLWDYTIKSQPAKQD